MNKKITILIIALIVTVIAAWEMPAFLQEDIPYPEPATCDEEYLNEIHIMRKAWEVNILSIAGQEKSASDMVDEAFKSTRTLRCWMEYLCRAVQYSGTAKDEEFTSAITVKQIGRIPGCSKPDTLQIPGTRLHLLEQCRIGDGATNTVEKIQTSFANCQRYMELNFGTPKAGQPSSVMLENLRNQSNVYITLESVLKRTNARQRARAVEAKLSDILNRMYGMEAQAQYLKNFLNKLYNLLPCYLEQCD